jgi:hypothetical protein
LRLRYQEAPFVLVNDLTDYLRCGNINISDQLLRLPDSGIILDDWMGYQSRYFQRKYSGRKRFFGVPSPRFRSFLYNINLDRFNGGRSITMCPLEKVHTVITNENICEASRKMLEDAFLNRFGYDKRAKQAFAKNQACSGFLMS